MPTSTRTGWEQQSARQSRDLARVGGGRVFRLCVAGRGGIVVARHVAPK